MEWYWWLLILIIVILIVWWALLRNTKATDLPKHEVEHLNDQEGQPELILPIQLPVEEKTASIVETRVDDLEVIEGIGPKIVRFCEKPESQPSFS